MNPVYEVKYEDKIMSAVHKHDYLLEVKNLSLTIVRYDRNLSPQKKFVIRDFHLSIQEGEILAIVGASGSGKSLLADTILGIHPKNAIVKGTIHYKNEPLTEKRKKRLRGKEIMMIPQMTSALDPLMKVGKQVKTCLKHANKKTLREIFERVGLNENVMNQLPANLSGGMIRRVYIAMALASEAKLIIADEPTNGLDQDAIDEMIQQLQMLANHRKGVILITHDIETALKIANKIAVFYAGETIEVVERKYFTGEGKHLRHPYTRALWKALPQNGFHPFNHNQPLSMVPIEGCTFATNCLKATELCKKKHPELKVINENKKVRCFYA